MVSSNKTLMAAFMLTLASCGKESEPINSTVSSDQAVETSSAGLESVSSELSDLTSGVVRQTISTMTFTKWGDVIVVDAATKKSENGKCKFVAPIISDASTQWSPFQIYWLIFDKESDVKNGTELSGVFADDDSRKSENLKRVDTGARPFGFAYLSQQAAGYVKLTPVETFDDGSRIHTILDISGHKAAIRSTAEAHEGGCKAKTEACVGGEACFSGGTFQPLGNIHVVQSMMGLPKEVRQQPSNGVTPGK